MRTITKTLVDYPAGYLTTEDKVSMIQRLSSIEMEEKKANTGNYSKKYDEAIAALLASITREVKALDAITFEEEL